MLALGVGSFVPAASAHGQDSRLTSIATGAHWGSVADMPAFKSTGYAFDVVTVNPNLKREWKRALDAARVNGLKLIIGGYPAPYSYSTRTRRWTITPAGVRLLDYLESRSSLVLALFVYNEPYSSSPVTGQTDPCGATSASQLRELRTKIRSIWPSTKIYHDIGWPSAWAPGGLLSSSTSCAGQKYADQSGVADYVGVWDYPFTSSGYRRTEALATLTRESNYVVNSMKAIPVWLGQMHSLPSENLVWPTSAELQDWNCAIRAALPGGSLISWYVWRQGIYSDYLANHPELWAMTTQAVC